MQFRLRNNTEALTGFIQGVAMEYDAGNQFLHYLNDMQIKVEFLDDRTLITILIWTKDHEYMPEVNINLFPNSDVEELHRQAVSAMETIHENYIRFFKR